MRNCLSYRKQVCLLYSQISWAYCAIAHVETKISCWLLLALQLGLELLYLICWLPLLAFSVKQILRHQAASLWNTLPGWSHHPLTQPPLCRSQKGQLGASKILGHYYTQISLCGQSLYPGMASQSARRPVYILSTGREGMLLGMVTTRTSMTSNWVVNLAAEHIIRHLLTWWTNCFSIESTLRLEFTIYRRQQCCYIQKDSWHTSNTTKPLQYRLREERIRNIHGTLWHMYPTCQNGDINTTKILLQRLLKEIQKEKGAIYCY